MIYLHLMTYKTKRILSVGVWSFLMVMFVCMLIKIKNLSVVCLRALIQIRCFIACVNKIMFVNKYK